MIMEKGKRIEDRHDLERAMSSVLSEIAQYDARTFENGRVPSWLFSDFAIDCDLMRLHPGEPFLWHTHDSGTYLHFIGVERDWSVESFIGWRKDFLKWDDWTYTELNYKWGYNLHKHPMERIYYYDGEYFREVSRQTALLIWRFTGLEIIHRQEDKLAERIA